MLVLPRLSVRAVDAAGAPKMYVPFTFSQFMELSSTVQNQPWCFYKSGGPVNKLCNPDTARVDCGMYVSTL